MSLIELLLIGVGVSMDAFSVAICKGLSVSQLRPRHALIVGAYFGGFQALMPLAGYLAGLSLAHFIQSLDHWIAFFLLLWLGLQMVRDALKNEECPAGDFSPKAMVPLALATSIDALAVGVTMAFLKVQIVSSVLIIGTCTFLFSSAGVVIGNFFGERFQRPARYLGGIILILLGCKILFEHLTA